MFQWLRSCSHSGSKAAYGTILCSLRLLKAASIGVQHLSVESILSQGFALVKSFFRSFLWLAIPAVDYSLKCRSTRKQSIHKYVTSAYFRYSQKKQRLNKTLCTCERAKGFCPLVEMDSTRLMWPCQALFQHFLKERISRLGLKLLPRCLLYSKPCAKL